MCVCIFSDVQIILFNNNVVWYSHFSLRNKNSAKCEANVSLFEFGANLTKLKGVFTTQQNQFERKLPEPGPIDRPNWPMRLANCHVWSACKSSLISPHTFLARDSKMDDGTNVRASFFFFSDWFNILCSAYVKCGFWWFELRNFVDRII